MALADAIRNTSARDVPEPRQATREVARPVEPLELERAREAHPSAGPRVRRPRLSIVPEKREGRAASDEG